MDDERGTKPLLPPEEENEAQRVHWISYEIDGDSVPKAVSGRIANQDRVSFGPNWVAVYDGMGSNAQSQEAARIADEVLSVELNRPITTLDAIHHFDVAVRGAAGAAQQEIKEKKVGGTVGTMLKLVDDQDGTMVLPFSCGDTRAYAVEADGIRLSLVALTRDQDLAAEAFDYYPKLKDLVWHMLKHASSKEQIDTYQADFALLWQKISPPHQEAIAETIRAAYRQSLRPDPHEGQPIVSIWDFHALRNMVTGDIGDLRSEPPYRTTERTLMLLLFSDGLGPLTEAEILETVAEYQQNPATPKDLARRFIQKAQAVEGIRRHLDDATVGVVIPTEIA